MFKNQEQTEDYLNGMTIWLKTVKKITSIDMLDLVDMMPEYEKWLRDNEDRS